MRKEGYRSLQIRKSTTLAPLESTAVRLSVSDSAMVGSSTFFKFGDIRRLFSSQCLNWIDARCPPCRDQAGHHCDGHQHRRCARKRRRIERLGSIEH